MAAVDPFRESPGFPGQGLNIRSRSGIRAVFRVYLKLRGLATPKNVFPSLLFRSVRSEANPHVCWIRTNGRCFYDTTKGPIGQAPPSPGGGKDRNPCFLKKILLMFDSLAQSRLGTGVPRSPSRETQWQRRISGSSGTVSATPAAGRARSVRPGAPAETGPLTWALGTPVVLVAA